MESSIERNINCTSSSGFTICPIQSVGYGPTLLPEHLPLDIQAAATQTTRSAFDLATVEKKHITQILHFTHGNKAETARLLGIGLSTLYRKLSNSN